MTGADLEVARIMGRRDLHETGAELLVHALIGEHGDLDVHDREPDRLADEGRPARIVGVHHHRRVAQHRLRARRRHGHGA